SGYTSLSSRPAMRVLNESLTQVLHTNHSFSGEINSRMDDLARTFLRSPIEKTDYKQRSTSKSPFWIPVGVHTNRACHWEPRAARFVKRPKPEPALVQPASPRRRVAGDPSATAPRA